jgi:hypothetical protein
MRWMLASSCLLFLVACQANSERSPALYEPAEEGRYLESPATLGRNMAADFEVAQEHGPALAENLPPDAAPARQVIYSAELRLVVVSALDAGDAVLAIAKEAGGWLQASDGSTITVRVPAETFERVLARLAKLGEVVSRNVHAADVTEEMLDLDIRLENLKKARERLLEHLAKSDKMEDTLRIEAELTRVTGELERIEGRKRFLAQQIAMSTITVVLNSRSGGREEAGLVVPFEWLLRLGDGLIAGAVEGRPRKPSLLSGGPDFTPPEGFLRYYSSKELVEAMDAEGLRIKVQRQTNFDDGALAFWKAMARRALVETRSLAVLEERVLADDRALLFGSREVGGEPYGYLLVLLRQKRHVFTFEAWGPRALFDAARPALEKSALGLSD